MKWIVGILLVIFISICGCSSAPLDTVVEPTPTIEVPTPVAVTPTWIQTVGPTPTVTNDAAECYNRSLAEPPQFCYDLLYWVKPTPIPPVGTGYTARVWRNSGCVNLNRTSGICEEWGNDLYNVLFLRNLTIVNNLTSINNTDLVAAVTYYNKTYDLNEIDGKSFDLFVAKYWDGTYPTQPYNKTSFAPDLNVTIVPIDTFNPNAFNYVTPNTTTTNSS